MTVAHQATCVALGGRAMLIEGPAGSGKSSLALALIDRGATLVGDDGVLLGRKGTRLYASPHPRIAGRIEVRNLGLLEFPANERAPVALLIYLDESAPRFPTEREHEERFGITLPLVRLWPRSEVLALRAELALTHFGLP